MTKHNFDWSTRSPPWNTLGPKIAAELRRVASAEPRDREFKRSQLASRFSGVRLRIIRQQQGMTLSDLSETSGYSADQIGQWERGEHFPREAAVTDLAEALGVDPRRFER